ncbi:beta-alanine-activating enzyme beta-propeller domain-containing protein, partial [Fervidobacterium sp.]
MVRIQRYVHLFVIFLLFGILVTSHALDVKILSPSNDSYVPSNFQVKVSATDPKGISRVELYVNGTKMSEKTEPPYEFQLPTNVGQVKWKYQTGGYIFSTAAISQDGTIYVGSSDSYLYAIRPDGTLKWKFGTNGDISSSPAIGADGTIYVGSGDSYLYAIKPDGKIKWKFKTDGEVGSSPAIGPDGTIYVGSWQAKFLYAIKPDGKLKWKFETDGNIGSSPAVGPDRTIYFGSMDTYLYAVRPEGKLKWKFQTGNGIRSSPAIGLDGTIYVGSEDGYLYAIRPDGTLKWKFETDGNIYSSPAIGADGTIYVGSRDNYLYAIRPDGTLKWKFKTDSSIDSSPVVGADGTIYFASDDDFIYAVSQNGEVLWKVEVSYSEEYIDCGLTIGQDGTLYAGSEDGVFYAIQTSSFGLVDSPWSKFRGNSFNTGLFGDKSVVYPPVEIKAVAYDKSGNKKEAVVKVKIDTNSPFVSFKTPKYGEFVKGEVNVEIDAKDESGISKVELYAGNQKISEKAKQPYTFKAEVGKLQNVINEPISVENEGKELWQSNLNGEIYSTPAISKDGTIYVGSYDKRLYAIDTAGNIKWTFEIDGKIHSSPAIDNSGRVYFGGLDGNFYALSSEGEQEWIFKTDGPIYSSPAISSDGSMIVFGSQDTFIYALTTDGELEWRFQTGGKVVSSPAIGPHGTIYVGSRDDYLYAISPSGELLWRFKTDGDVDSSPAIGADGTIYVGSEDRYLYAIRPDGTLKWKFGTNGGIYSSPAIGADGTIYVRSEDGYLYAIDQTGVLKWKFNSNSSIDSSPLIGADGVIYIVSRYKVYALTPNGEKKWEFSSGWMQFTTSPTVGNNGELYVGSSDGKLFAIQTSSIGLATSPWPKFRRNAINTADIFGVIDYAAECIVLKAVAYDSVGNKRESYLLVRTNSLPPSVQILNYKDNDVVNGEITIKLFAIDKSGIKKVEAYFDNAKMGEKFHGPYEFTIDTTKYEEKAYKFTVVVTDQYENSSQQSITLIIDRTPPEVSITNLKDSSIIGIKPKISVSASDKNAISKVELFINGNKLAEKTTEPFDFEVKIPDGTLKWK